ncbi:hypothetical protein AYI69_g7217 [Smittium culicis]|uniref:Hexosyltransferase n=1 Tax=Smittium culicis TaxID=133412 RepID=A0A1R1XTU2_9FUNG|nr:hypothetical protein AYI69_g7217 [Smittium culicis]
MSELFKKTSDDLFPFRPLYLNWLNSTYLRPRRAAKKSLLDLRNEYVIIMPINAKEDPQFIFELYSDANLITVCDRGDERAFCDVIVDPINGYWDLPAKTFDMFNRLCEGIHEYKVFIKMDFDIFINKDYLYDVITFMAENSDKRIYFGDNNYVDSEFKQPVMNGKIYAITSKILQDYCTCDIEKPGTGLEDYWLGYTIHNCTDSKNYTQADDIFQYKSHEKEIFHKKYGDYPVKISLGTIR